MSFLHFRKVESGNFSGFEKAQIMGMYVRCEVFYKKRPADCFPLV